MKISNKDNIMYLDKGKLEIFTPQRYLGSSTNINGDKIECLGLVPYKYYENEKDKKPTKVGMFNNPSLITFYPVNIDQNVVDTVWDGIYDNPNENEYMRLTFEAGGRLMNQYGVKALKNVVLFTELLLGGKLDNNIPYQYLAPSWIKNMIMNNVSLSVPASVINMIVSELCRSNKDMSKKFSMIIGKDPKTSPVSYQFANIREICASNSVYAALSFEDMNAMLDSSLNMTLQGKAQTISPVEQIMYM